MRILLPGWHFINIGESPTGREGASRVALASHFTMPSFRTLNTKESIIDQTTCQIDSLKFKDLKRNLSKSTLSNMNSNKLTEQQNLSPEVPPTAVTYILEAGNTGLYPQYRESTPSPETPASPAALSIVTPWARSLIASISNMTIS